MVPLFIYHSACFGTLNPGNLGRNNAILLVFTLSKSNAQLV
jgi:hypothetical protein